VLTDKRAVMDEINDDFAGTVRGAFDREAGQSYLSGLADAKDEAEERARRFAQPDPDEDEDTSSYEEYGYQESEDAP
jgi:hypothetical protein